MTATVEKALAKRAREPEGAESPLPVERVSETVLAGLRAALLGGETHYTDRPGMRALRERIGERIGRSPDAVIVTAGSKEARYVIELSGSEAPVIDIGDAVTTAEALENLDASSIVVGTLDGLPELRSFRLAFLAAPDELAPKLKSWKQALSICTAAPSQRAALLAWTSR